MNQLKPDTEPLSICSAHQTPVADCSACEVAFAVNNAAPKSQDTQPEWYDNKHAQPICDIVSEMLDNPKDGIYPTSKCYKALNDYVCQEMAAAEERGYERGKFEGEMLV